MRERRGEEGAAQEDGSISGEASRPGSTGNQTGRGRGVGAWDRGFRYGNDVGSNRIGVPLGEIGRSVGRWGRVGRSRSLVGGGEEVEEKNDGK